MGTINAMRSIIIISLLTLAFAPCFAQQDALYSQYMFNAFTLNPAYAGSRQALSIVALGREQWLGFKDGPSSQTLSVHSPIQGKKFALGVNVINDQIGPSSSMGVFASYAYHLQLTSGKLAFGLRGGGFQSSLNQSELKYKDETEVYSSEASLRAFVPSFDFGMYYYGKKHYIGFSATHLTEQRVNYKGNWQQADLFLKRHYMLSAGYAFKMSENIFFKPSLLTKFIPGAPLNVDVNCSFLFYNTLWLGASYRHNSAAVLLTEINVTDFIRVGYSYDMMLNRLKTYSKGSHEIFVGFDFRVAKTKSVPTRLL